MNSRRVAIVAVLLLCLILFVGGVSASGTVTGGTQDYNNIVGTGGVDVTGYTNQTSVSGQYITAESLSAVVGSDNKTVTFTISGQRGAAVSYDTSTNLINGGMNWQYTYPTSSTETVNFDLVEEYTDSGTFTPKVHLYNPSNTTGVWLTANSITVGSQTITITTAPSVTPTTGTTSTSLTASIAASVSTGSISGYQWYYSTNSGSSWTAVSGATSATSTFTLGSTGTYKLKCIITGSSGGTLDSYSEGGYTSVSVTIGNPPTVNKPTANPTYGALSNSVALSVTASGSVTGYQWQHSTDGSSYSDISGANQSTYTATISDSAATTHYYRVVVYGTYSTTTSDACTYVSYAAPSVNKPTISKTEGVLSTTVDLSVSAGGDISGYQWKQSTNGTTWTAISGATQSSYTATISDSTGTTHYYMVTVTGKGGQTDSDSVTYTSYAAPSVNKPTISKTEGVLSTTVDLSVSASGDITNYQWKQSTNGTTWTAISGATQSSYTATISDSTGTTHYYMVTVTGKGGQTDSESVTYTSYPAPTVNKPTISKTKGTLSTTVDLSVSASGNITGYQWKESTNGTTWTAISGATQSSYTATISDSTGTTHYYMVTVTGKGGQTDSESVTYTSYPKPTVNTPTISQTEGALSVSLNLGVTASGDITGYQWKQSTNGTTYTDISGATQSTYTATITDTAGTTHYYMVTVTGAGGSQDSTPVTYTSYPAPTVNKPTISKTEGVLSTTVDLSVSASGNITGYQWKQSTNGTTYTAISGATQSSYTATISDSVSTTHYYMVTVTGKGGTVDSDSVTYTSYAKPAITALSVSPTDGGYNTTFTLTATASGHGTLTYEWFKSNNGSTWTTMGTTSTGSKSFTLDAPYSYQFKVTVTDSLNQTTDSFNDYSTFKDVYATAYAPPQLNNLMVEPSVGTTSTEFTAMISTSAGGSADPLFRWFTSSDNGSTWTQISTDKSPTFTLNTAGTYHIKVQVTDGYGQTTDSWDDEGITNITATVYGQPVISAVSVSPTEGTLTSTFTLTSTATGYGTLSYQWYSSSDNGSTWNTISGATSSTSTTTLGTAGTYLFKVQVTDGLSQVKDSYTDYSTFKSVTATSYAKPTVNKPTISKTEGALSTTVDLSVTASGNITSYQWKQSTNGTTYTDISGANQSTYTATISDSSATTHYYMVTVTGKGGSQDSDSVTYTSYASPVITGETADPTRGALNNTVELSATVTGDGIISYQWQENVSGTWTNLTGKTSATEDVTIADTTDTVHTYRLQVVGKGGTVNSGSVTYTSIAKPIITSLSADPTEGALNNSVSLTAVVSGADSYQWQQSTDGTNFANISGATTKDYTATISDTAATTHTYRLQATSAGGTTTATSSQYVTYTSYAKPVVSTPTISKTEGVLSTTVDLSVTATGNISGYQWKQSTDGTTYTAISGATQSTYTATISDSSATTHYYMVTVSGKGGSQDSSVVTYTSYLKPVITNEAISKTEGALETTITLGATVTGQTSVQWQELIGSTWTDLSGKTALSVSVTISDSSATTHTYRLKATGIGGESYSDSLTYTSYAKPVISNVTANPTYGAFNNTVDLSATVTGATSYQWQESTNGTTYTPITGATSTTYTATISDSTPTTHYYKITATGTGGSVTLETPVTYVSYARPVVSNVTVSPANGALTQELTLSATVSGETSVKWQILNGSTWTDISGATTNPYTYTPTLTAGSHEYRIVAVGNGGTTESTSAVYQAYPAPAFTSWTVTPASGSSPLTVNYSASATNTTSYKVEKSADGTEWETVGTSASGSFTLTGAGTYSVRITATGYGGSTTNASVKTVTVYGAPVITASASDIGIDKSVTLSTSSTGFSSIKYQVLNGSTWEDISGATTASYSWTPSSVGTYSVRASVTYATTSDVSNTVTVTVHAKPTITAAISETQGTLTDTFTLTATVTGDSTTVTWYEGTSSIGTGVSKQVTLSDSTGTVHTYHATVTDTYGNTATSGNVTFTSYPAPVFSSVSVTPTVGANPLEVTLSATASNTNSYTWERKEISAASWTTITPVSGKDTISEAGTYLYRVTAYGYGGETTSDEYQVISVSEGVIIDSVTATPTEWALSQTYTLTATAHTTASGITIMKYNWYYRLPSGGNWVKITNAETASVTFTPTVTGQYTFKVIIPDSLGNTTDSYDSGFTNVHITAVGTPSVDSATINVSEGAYTKSITLTGTASIQPSGSTINYQWQKSTDESTWNDISGANKSTYTETMTFTSEYTYFRLKVSNAYNESAYSSTLTYHAIHVPAFTTWNVTPASGSNPLTVTYNAVASDTDSYSVEMSENQITWTEIGTASTGTYEISNAGTYYFRATATGAGGSTTTQDIRSVTVYGQPVITVSPATTGVDNSVTLSTSSTGFSSIKYQVLDGSTWTDISGATTSTSTWTPSAAGTYSVRAFVSYATTTDTSNTVTVTVIGKPTATATISPSEGSFTQTVTLTGTVTTSADYDVQWQEKSGSTYSDISGKTLLESTVTLSDSTPTTHTYRMKVTDEYNNTGYSNDVTFTSYAKPVISGVSVTPVSGATTQSLVFNASSVTGATSYQWQEFNGSAWTNIAGATTNPYTYNATVTTGEHQYRLVATGTGGSQESDSVTYTAYGRPVISSISATPSEGALSNTVTLTGTATGAPNLTYKWQEKVNDVWTDLGTTATQTVTISDETATVHTYRLEVSDYGGTVDSDNVTYTSYASPVISSVTANPTEGGFQNTVSLSATVTGANAYQWQESTNGTTWTDITGATFSTFSATVNDSTATTHYYRIVATGKGGESTSTQEVTYTSYAKPVVSSITANPTQGALHNSVSLSATVTGGNTYQWQESTNGTTFTDISGATGTTYTATISDSSATTHTYKLKVYGTGGNIESGTVTYTSYAQPVISSVSASPVQGALSSTVNLSASVTGANEYQWQELDGSTWTDISGKTSLSVSVPISDSSATVHTYRIKASGIGGDSYSDNVTYTTYAKPVITDVSANPVQGALSNTVNLSASVTGANTYRWEESTNGTTWTDITGASSLNYPASVNDSTATTHYYRIVASGIGGESTSTQEITYRSYELPVITNVTASPVQGGLTQNVSLSATVTGEGAMTYQWQENLNDVWTDISGKTSQSVSVPVSDSSAKVHTYRLKASGIGGDSYSDSVIYTSYALPVISNVTVNPSEGALTSTTTLTATVTGANTYQWLESTNGTTYTAISGATGTTYTATITDSSATTHYYKITATGTGGSTTSENPVTYTTYAQPVISNVDATPTEGGLTQNVSLSATVSGANTYQWLESTNGTTYTAISGATGTTYTATINDSAATTHYYKITATGTGGSTTSENPVTYTSYAKPVITGETISQTEGKLNETITLSATVTGANAYQWQESTNGGSTWTDLSGKNTQNVSVTVNDVTATVHSYRLKASGIGGDSYSTASLTYTSHNAPAITNVTVEPSTGVKAANITLNATVTDANTYKWQISTNGTSYTDIANATTVPWTGAVTMQEGTNYLRLHAEGIGGQTDSTAVTYTGVSELVIATAGVSPTTGSLTQELTFSYTMTKGTPSIWNWEEKNGSTWTTVSTVQNPVITLSDSVSTTHTYRLTVSDAYGQTDTSDEFTFVSVAAPVISNQTISATEGGLTPTLTLNATVTDASSYTWQQSNDNGSTWVDVQTSTTSATLSKTFYFPSSGTYKFRLTATGTGGSTTMTTSQYLTFVAYGAPSVTNPQISVTEGALVNSVTVSATATGSSSKEYQWYTSTNGGSSWVEVEDGDTNPCVISINDSTGTVHQFRLTVTDYGEMATSSAVTYTSLNPPVIQNVTISKSAGNTTADYTVSATVSNASSMKWQELIGSTWTDITGATTSTYTFNTTVSIGTHTYRLWATNAGGVPSTSTSVTYTAYGLPTVNSVERTPEMGGLNSSVTLTVSASGAPNLTYQWYETTSGTPVIISGATMASYTKQVNDSSATTHSYNCVVTDYGGSVTSGTVYYNTITVPYGGVATVTPTIGTTTPTISLSANPSGQGTLTYQWYYTSGSGSSPIAINGATQTTWNGTITLNEGTTSFFLRTTNEVGYSDSDVAVYQTYPSPTVTISASATEVQTGGSSTITATEQYAQSRTWYQSNDTGVTWTAMSSTSNPLTVSGLTAGTHQYKCVVHGLIGRDVTSNVITIFAGSVPQVTITSPTTGASYVIGNTVSFTATQSADTESIQWDFGGDSYIVSGGGSLTPVVRYQSGGDKTVRLTGYNRFGSNYYEVRITVSTSIRTAATSSVTHIDNEAGSSMMNFINTVTTPDETTQMPNLMGIITGIFNPYTSIVGAWFYLFLFAVPYVILWIRQKNTMIPSIIGIIFGAFMIVKFPASAIAPACIILAISIAGGLYGLYVRKTNQ